MLGRARPGLIKDSNTRDEFRLEPTHSCLCSEGGGGGCDRLSHKNRHKESRVNIIFSDAFWERLSNLV